MRTTLLCSTVFPLLLGLIPMMPTMNSQNQPTEACTPSHEPAIRVTITDSVTNAPLEATVAVSADNFQEELELNGVMASGHPVYGGAFERPGLYTITVSREGYTTSVVEEIEVEHDGCHVLTQQLDVRLQPMD